LKNDLPHSRNGDFSISKLFVGMAFRRLVPVLVAETDNFGKGNVFTKTKLILCPMLLIWVQDLLGPHIMDTTARNILHP